MIVCAGLKAARRDGTSAGQRRREEAGSRRVAERECAAFHKRTGRIINLLTVQEILEEKRVQKM